MALRLSLSKRRKPCFTSLEPALMFKECSATSLGMPGMSEGFHAKMLLFARRKSTSAPSYLGDRVAPIRTVRPLELLGSRGTSLTPSVASKEVADCLESG